MVRLNFSFFHNEHAVCSYSVSSLKTTIFCQNRQFFRSTFLSPWLIPHFVTLMGGSRGHVLPPIRVTKCGVKQEQRKVDLKLTLTNEIISRKIVASRHETLYQVEVDEWWSWFLKMPNCLFCGKLKQNMYFMWNCIIFTKNKSDISSMQVLYWNLRKFLKIWKIFSGNNLHQRSYYRVSKIKIFEFKLLLLRNCALETLSW